MVVSKMKASEKRNDEEQRKRGRRIMTGCNRENIMTERR